MSMVPTGQPQDHRSVRDGIFRSPQKRRLILCLLLALATVALYSPVTRAPFLNYDDPVYVSGNARVRAGLTWKTIEWAFRTPKALDWHPLTWLSYALDRQLFGLNPAGYHCTNLFLHMASAVLLFLILEAATGFLWRSLAVAALFALHPINVESVAWIAERKNVLSMFFFLVALAAYGWYARRPGAGRYIAVTAAYVLALMSKAQAITFPFAVLLLDYWPLRRIGRDFPATTDESICNQDLAIVPAPSLLRVIAEKLPWFALSCASAIITMATGSGFTYVVETSATRKFPAWIAMATAVTAYPRYLGKAFWPLHLALVYPHPGFATSKPLALLSALIIIAISALVFVLRRHRFLFVGWFWFLGTMLPMSGIVPIGPHTMADRYAYIPLLGIFVIVCWGAADLAQRLNLPNVVCAAGATAVLVALGCALFRQASYWDDNVKLWDHTVEITENNFTAEEQVAMALIVAGKPAQAFPHLQRAHFLQPTDPLATLNLATYQQMVGNYQDAIDGYAMLVQIGAVPPMLANAHSNSGYAHLSLKQYDGARREFEAALHEQPENSSAYRGLGLLAEQAGDISQAARDYQRSVELQPSPVGYLLLAQALEIGKQPEAARAAQTQARHLTTDLNDDMAVVRQLLAN